jgi:hypothetical protein
MTTLSKILLTVAITCTAAGSVIASLDTLASPTLAAVLPLGAIAFGMFLIVFMMEKEVAKYDEEQATKMQRYQSNAAAPLPDRKPVPQGPTVYLKEKML